MSDLATRCDAIFAEWGGAATSSPDHDAIRALAREDHGAFERWLSLIAPEDERTQEILYETYEALCTAPAEFGGLLRAELDRMLGIAARQRVLGPAWEAALAFQCLANGAPDGVVERLLKATAGPANTVRSLAIDILGCAAKERHPAAIQRLRELLASDPDWMVRAQAFEALIELDPEADVVWFDLGRAMRQDEDHRVRHHAGRCAWSWKVAPRLSESLRDLSKDPIFLVRRAAILALRGSGENPRGVSLIDRLRIALAGSTLRNVVIEEQLARSAQG